MTTYSDDQVIPIRLNNYEIEFGLTKREYFAAMALQGILVTDGNVTLQDRVIISVKTADLLIEELNKEKV